MGTLSSPLGISGIVLLITGVIMAIIGIIFLVINQNNQKDWWMWLLFIGGLILAIIGCVLLAISASKSIKLTYTTETVPETVPPKM